MSKTQQILALAQLASAVLLTLAILSQNRSSGLSNVFGGSGAIYRTKRGLEKWLFYTTIVLSLIFVGLSIAVVLVKSF
jgi:preprotein translocase subunit SecG